MRQLKSYTAILCLYNKNSARMNVSDAILLTQRDMVG